MRVLIALVLTLGFGFANFSIKDINVTDSNATDTNKTLKDRDFFGGSDSSSKESGAKRVKIPTH